MYGAVKRDNAKTCQPGMGRFGDDVSAIDVSVIALSEMDVSPMDFRWTLLLPNFLTCSVNPAKLL